MKMTTRAPRGRNTRRHGILMVLGISACAAVASTAGANNNSEPRSVTVSLRDLDMSRPSDVRTLKRRLHRAAEVVCGDDFPHDPRLLQSFTRCVDQATEEALAEVDPRYAEGPRQSK